MAKKGDTKAITTTKAEVEATEKEKKRKRFSLIPEEECSYTPPDGYDDKQKAYLVGLARTGTMKGACSLARINWHAPYRWREQDETFQEVEKKANEHFTEYLEQQAFEMASYNPTMLIFMLKGRKPERYAEYYKQEITGAGGKPIEIVFNIPRPAAPPQKSLPGNTD